MIIFSGYGLFVVVGIFVGCFFAMSKITAGANDAEQVVAILITMAIATVINYLVARFLNRNEVKHTLYQVKLQNAVLAIGILVEVVLLFTQWRYIMQFIHQFGA